MHDGAVGGGGICVDNLSGARTGLAVGSAAGAVVAVSRECVNLMCNMC